MSYAQFFTEQEQFGPEFGGWAPDWGRELVSFNELVSPPPMTMEHWRNVLAAHPEYQAQVKEAVGYALSRPTALRRQTAKAVADQLNQVDFQLASLTPGDVKRPLRAMYKGYAAGVFGNSIGDDQLTGKGMAYAEFIAPGLQGLHQQVRQAAANEGIPSGGPLDDTSVVETERKQSDTPGGTLSEAGSRLFDLAERALDSGPTFNMMPLAAGVGILALLSIGALIVFKSKDESP